MLANRPIAGASLAAIFFPSSGIVVTLTPVIQGWSAGAEWQKWDRLAGNRKHLV